MGNAVVTSGESEGNGYVVWELRSWLRTDEVAVIVISVYSVIIFLLEKTIISEMSNIELVISLSNEKFQTFIMFLLLGLVGIVGAIYLLLCKYPKDA